MVQFRSEELADAFRKWLEEVRLYLRDKAPRSKAIMDTGTRLIIHHQEGRYVSEEVPVPQSPSGLVYDYRDEIHNLPTYKIVADALQTCLANANLAGTFVGTSAGATLMQSEHIPETFIHEYWLKNRSLEYWEVCFTEIYASLESVIYENELVRNLNAPLQNFDSDMHALTFEEGLTARLMTPELYEGFYLRGGTFRSEYKTEHRGLRLWVLEVCSTEKKVIRGEHDPATVDEDQCNMPYRLAEDLIKALRIYKCGAPMLRSIDEHTIWVYHSGRSYPALTFPKNKPVTLTRSELEDFRKFFTTFRRINLRKDRFLRVALERFNNALDRQTPEDSVIDLSICLEALLLSGLGNEEDRGNVSYRFALHGARLLAKDIGDRRRLYRKLKQVYGVRSKIVHGAESYDLPKGDLGKEITIDQFCASLEEIARACFHRFFSEFERTGGSCRIDWNSIVLN
jgi:hypothetical protein